MLLEFLIVGAVGSALPPTPLVHWSVEPPGPAGTRLPHLKGAPVKLAASAVRVPGLQHDANTALGATPHAGGCALGASSESDGVPRPRVADTPPVDLPRPATPYGAAAVRRRRRSEEREAAIESSQRGDSNKILQFS